jgi:ATP:cob(I)alamin adenosyltransferase
MDEGLRHALEHHQKFGKSIVKLFELGKVYSESTEQNSKQRYHEPRHAAFVLYDMQSGKEDIYRQSKGIVEMLCKSLGISYSDDIANYHIWDEHTVYTCMNLEHNFAQSRRMAASSKARLHTSIPRIQSFDISCLVSQSAKVGEINGLTGWCRVACPTELLAREQSVRDMLRDVQDHLFTIQAEVAGAPKSVPQASVETLGEVIAAIERSLPEVKTFLVPGGTEFSARLDIARAVSRRVERRLVQLHESGERTISPSSRAYANRLSSLLYALTRLANDAASIAEMPPQYRDA